MAALGAIPVQLPFAQIVEAIRHGVVDCAITGTRSGGEIGLPEVTSHISPLAISWGLSFFGTNRETWNQFPADIREQLGQGIHRLEDAIWEAADRETAVGLPVDTGSGGCENGRTYNMKLVRVACGRDCAQAASHSLHSAAMDPTLCQDCVEAWNSTLGPELNIQVSARSDRER